MLPVLWGGCKRERERDVIIVLCPYVYTVYPMAII